MKRWIQAQLNDLPTNFRIAVVLDPERLLEGSDWFPGVDVFGAGDWFSLRSVYEELRVEDGSDRRAIIHINSPEFLRGRDLPYDIERETLLLRLRIPVPSEFRQLVVELPDSLSDRAVDLLLSPSSDRLGSLMGGLWGLAKVAAQGPADGQLAMAARLRTDYSVPSALWPLVRPLLSSPLALALANEPPAVGVLQAAWNDWLSGGRESEFDSVFRATGVQLAPLFYSGLMKTAVIGSTDLPDWVGFGARELSPVDAAASLIDARPTPWPPITAAEWQVAAEWWGELRSVLAEGAPETDRLVQDSWLLWSELDRAFSPWLKDHLGELMTSSGKSPLTVDKIVPYLARRLREGSANRVLLIVADGMSHCQWSTVRRYSDVEVKDAAASFAMIPTLTSISRQAIFAGARPHDFADSIRTTSKEARRWSDAWIREGVAAKRVSYVKTSGSTRKHVPPLGDNLVVGVVVTAVDEILHGSDVLGDAQVTQAVISWARHGFLKELISAAVTNGFEVWLTSDHGNIESLPLGRVSEGLLVESAGVRVRWYPNGTLRDAAKAEGDAWDPPGLPSSGIFPLFAPGRGGFFTGERRVTHGGLSLDEVLVPLVRVVA